MWYCSVYDRMLIRLKVDNGGSDSGGVGGVSGGLGLLSPSSHNNNNNNNSSSSSSSGGGNTNSIEAIHGSLLVVTELLRTTGKCSVVVGIW